jgi:hypothetical protein
MTGTAVRGNRPNGQDRGPGGHGRTPGASSPGYFGWGTIRRYGFGARQPAG